MFGPSGVERCSNSVQPGAAPKASTGWFFRGGLGGRGGAGSPNKLLTGIRMHYTPEHCNLSMVVSHSISVLRKSQPCVKWSRKKGDLKREPPIPKPHIGFLLAIEAPWIQVEVLSQSPQKNVGGEAQKVEPKLGGTMSCWVNTFFLGGKPFFVG